jgi:hypothetical protein
MLATVSKFKDATSLAIELWIEPERQNVEVEWIGPTMDDLLSTNSEINLDEVFKLPQPEILETPPPIKIRCEIDTIQTILKTDQVTAKKISNYIASAKLNFASNLPSKIIADSIEVKLSNSSYEENVSLLPMSKAQSYTFVLE